MNDVDVAVAVNPFEDNVIGQPRTVRYSVTTVHSTLF